MKPGEENCFDGAPVLGCEPGLGSFQTSAITPRIQPARRFTRRSSTLGDMK